MTCSPLVPRRQRLFRGSVLGAVLLLASVPLTAQVTLSGTLDTADNTYVYDPNYNASTATLSASVKPSLTYAFSTAGDTVVTTTWSAPTGKVIVIAAPDGWSDAGIEFVYRGGTRTGDAYFEAHSVQGVTAFTDLTGSISSGSGATLVFAVTDRYEVDTYLNVTAGGRVSFSSVSVTYTVPESLNYDYTAVAATDITVYGNATAGGAELGSPGNWIFLEDAPGGGSAVPEPSTYALLCGAAMLGFVAWRRRR